jgi:hypothetical protein
MTQEKSIIVTVTVDDAHTLSEVVGNLKKKGFVLKKSLEAIGVLTGSVPASALDTLSAVPGVLAVEKERNDYRTQE